MPAALPYVPSYGKIKTLFTKIASAKVPDSFTHAYLSQTLGLKSTSDPLPYGFFGHLVETDC
jgi:hypothetical protein